MRADSLVLLATVSAQPAQALVETSAHFAIKARQKNSCMHRTELAMRHVHQWHTLLGVRIVLIAKVLAPPALLWHPVPHAYKTKLWSFYTQIHVFQPALKDFYHKVKLARHATRTVKSAQGLSQPAQAAKETCTCTIPDASLPAPNQLSYKEHSALTVTRLALSAPRPPPNAQFANKAFIFMKKSARNAPMGT